MNYRQSKPSSAHLTLAVSAAVTASVATLVVTWLLTVTGQGIEAAEEVRVKRVLEQELITDSGIPHAQAIDQLEGEIVAMSTKVASLESELRAIREHMRNQTR